MKKDVYGTTRGELGAIKKKIYYKYRGLRPGGRVVTLKAREYFFYLGVKFMKILVGEDWQFKIFDTGKSTYSEISNVFILRTLLNADAEFIGQDDNL